MSKDLEQTFCYTYEVKMVVQILDINEKEAREKLDKNGGYVSFRDVTLLDSLPLYSGSDK